MQVYIYTVYKCLITILKSFTANFRILLCSTFACVNDRMKVKIFFKPIYEHVHGNIVAFLHSSELINDNFIRKLKWFKISTKENSIYENCLQTRIRISINFGYLKNTQVNLFAVMTMHFSFYYVQYRYHFINHMRIVLAIISLV